MPSSNVKNDMLHVHASVVVVTFWLSPADSMSGFSCLLYLMKNSGSIMIQRAEIEIALF